MANSVRVVAEEIVRDAFVYENVIPSLGLIIGGNVSETNQVPVVHLSPTFDEIEKSEDESNGGERVSKSFTSLLPRNITHHAKQVIRMLPGGIFVIGLYVVEPVEDIFIGKYELTIKNLITSLNKGLGKNSYYQSDFGCTGQNVLIHYNPDLKNFNCRLFESDGLKSRKVDLQFDRLKWSKIECEFDSQSAMHLEKDASLPLQKNLLLMMKSITDTMDKASFLIDGQRPSSKTIYRESDVKSPEIENGISDLEDEDRGEGDDEFDEEEEKVQIHINRPVSPVHILFKKIPAINLQNGKNGGEEFINHLRMQGKFAACAFVTYGSSTEFVAKMLKQDILRSLASRFEMHCESLIDEESPVSEENERVYHEIPRRVFAFLPGSKILFSDYLFPGEGPQDSLVSFRDILSIRLEDETDVMVNKEKPFDFEEMQTKGSMEELLSKAENITKMPPYTKTKSAFFYLLIAAVIFGILSIFLPLILHENFPQIFQSSSSYSNEAGSDNFGGGDERMDSE